MFETLTQFLLHWAITALSLWAASLLFKGLKFSDTGSLVLSALLLGFANAIVKPSKQVEVVVLQRIFMVAMSLKPDRLAAINLANAV